MAVDHRWQGQGIGKALLKDAVLRTLQAADIAGIRCIVVHAKDDQAKAFYPYFDSIPAPTDPFHLFLMLKDVRSSLS
ncbi:MAG: GNAT family N-acetyltransferase [Desulfobacteraceae bacterium]|nr:GNAT family N-acetyltransferase [Desulfobacteraceae bacterium]